MKITKSIKASEEFNPGDLYIVKIWYEIDPGHDVAVPEAAEEIFEIVADSPDQAKEYARMQWDGPIDRIEIVDINPEGYDYEEPLPFDASSDNSGKTAIEGDDFLTDEQKEILRNANTDDWAAMQNERTENAIREAGGYANWIKEARQRESMYNKNKRGVRAAEVFEERKWSQASFDFAHDGYYSEEDIDRCIRLAFEDADVTVEDTSYHAVDYSDYKEYDDVTVSQVDVDFSWDTDYNSDFIESRLDQELAAIGYELLGIDFRSLH